MLPVFAHFSKFSMYAWGKKRKLLVFTAVYVCVKAKLTLVFCLHLSLRCLVGSLHVGLMGVKLGGEDEGGGGSSRRWITIPPAAPPPALLHLYFVSLLCCTAMQFRLILHLACL